MKMLCRNYLLVVFCISCLLLLVLCQNEQSVDKRKEEIRAARDKSTHQFRSVRVNQVWEKAQRIGKSPKELERLKVDLKKYDEKAYQLKKLERDGGDATGEQSEKMHKQLTEIMKKHNIVPKDKPNKQTPTKDKPFDDKRLNELWKKTLDAQHFDDNEVKIMKQQLKIHQEKINQYQELVDDLYGENSHPAAVQAKRNNAVDKDEFQAREMDLKLQHKRLNKDFQTLNVKTIPEEERGGFNEPRIINFWKDAQKTNFTEEELISLKEELRHFEGKLMKYDTMQEEAMYAERTYKKKKMNGEKVDMKKHTAMREKVKDIGNSVKKFFTSMKEKISSRKQQHNEL
ncbi:alpha-2-macroglobulin receptor-associated protein-like [Antedon mediterranea]|uniref:alpha-2-macroglobulin receptor-associated protein-like n=1 Tax=Antedon mediterranea TaxID=105859 RepID=UPI003AF88EE3